MSGFKLNMANILTSVRVICSLALLFCQAFSIPFYVLYITAGFTDMIDGTVARKTGSVSEFGSKFDTVADLIFVAVCLIKLIPVLKFVYGGRMNAAAVVAEVGPPLATDESCLAGKELTIDMTAIGDDRTLPLPQWPVPPAVGQDDVAAVVVDHLFGRETTDAAVEQRQESRPANQLHQLRAVVYAVGSHLNIFCANIVR